MSDEHRNSLAAQAASWVPPWERAARKPDRAYQVAAAAEPDAGEPFDAEEFARRTAARARVDPGRGREYATAVLATLREDVAGIQELRDRLPADYRPLFG